MTHQKVNRTRGAGRDRMSPTLPADWARVKSGTGQISQRAEKRARAFADLSQKQTSGQERLDHFRIGDCRIGQRVVAAVVWISETLVVEPQRVKQRSMQVVDPNNIPRRFITKVVGSSMNVALLEATAGQPERKGATVMITTVGPLRNRLTPEFTRPQERSSSQAGPVA